MRRALQAPARQIAENAGEDGSVVVGKILENGKYNFGYNAQTGAYGDLVQPGVIDPAKVVRCALQDAGLRGRPADHHRGHGGRAAEEAAHRRCPAAAAWAAWGHGLL